jgi:hypothetical protein
LKWSLLCIGYQTPEIVHWMIIANYKEDLDVMRATLNALSVQSIGAHRVIVF